MKIEFALKAIWVKDSHWTPDLLTSSYTGVLSREYVSIALNHADLLGIKTMAADIRNAYLQASSYDMDYIICVPEFGIDNVGRVALIQQSLYVGKVSGRDFWLHLLKCMDEIVFESSKSDPDVLFRASKSKNGDDYYDYAHLYVYNCLVISDRTESLMKDEIGQHFLLKKFSIGPPLQYLGGKFCQVKLENGKKSLSWGLSQYVQAPVKNL